MKPPVAVAMGLVALFAIFHGYAHGIETPLDGATAAYGAGFMLATALLHADRHRVRRWSAASATPTALRPTGSAAV